MHMCMQSSARTTPLARTNTRTNKDMHMCVQSRARTTPLARTTHTNTQRHAHVRAKWSTDDSPCTHNTHKHTKTRHQNSDHNDSGHQKLWEQPTIVYLLSCRDLNSSKIDGLHRRESWTEKKMPLMIETTGGKGGGWCRKSNNKRTNKKCTAFCFCNT